MPASGSVPIGHAAALELVEQMPRPTAAMHKSATVEVEEPGSDQMDMEDGVASKSKSTHDDLRGMRRMGKDQQLVRTFRQMSIMSFVALATATWEIGLFIITPALVDGGRAGLVWSCLWAWIGFAPVYLSMAEMASMAPIAGAQYHWVSEFAPDKYQKFLSYIAGWVSTIAWQAGNAMGIFLTGSLIQTIILINNPNYGFPSYQGTLLAIAMAILCYVVNIYTAKILPYWQNLFFALHIVAYFAYVVPIWVNAPTATHWQVWGDFQNEGGWSSMGLAILVGQLTGISEQCGIDTTAHMSEEVKNAAKAVPRTMVIIYFLNFILLYPAIVTICYHIPELEASINDPTGYPAIYVMRKSMSNAWITVILAIVSLILAASCIDYFAAVTRDLFAFARDNGMPFSRWLSTVHPKKHLPVNASIVSTVVAGLLSLIYIGSPVAFYAITSLSTVSLLMCYTLSIGSVLYRRLYKPETLPPAQFSLGRWGTFTNASAVAWGIWSFFWCFWPQGTPVNASGFNWASPIFAIVVIFSLGYYYFRARHVYVGPVTEVEGRKSDFL